MDEKDAKAELKWYQSRALYIAVSVILTGVVFFQNCQIQQNQERVSKENEDIRHRLDYRDSKEWVTIVNGAKDREKAYFETRNQLEQIILHCKTNPCDLPTDLAIIKTERQFDSMEAIILKEHKEQ